MCIVNLLIVENSCGLLTASIFSFLFFFLLIVKLVDKVDGMSKD